MQETTDQPATADDGNQPKEPLTEPSTVPQLPRSQPFEVSILALQNTTLFPETVVPLAVGRPRSIGAVEAALASEEKFLGCITVRADVSTSTQDASSAHLYQVGTLAIIKRMERIESTMHIIAQGTERVKVLEFIQEEPFIRARVEILPELKVVDQEEVEATRRNVQSMVQEALALMPG